MENAGATTRENGEQRGVVGGNNGNFAGVALARPCPQSALTRGERAKKSQPTRVGILVLVVGWRPNAAYHGCNEFPQAPIGDDSTLIAVF